MRKLAQASITSGETDLPKWYVMLLPDPAGRAAYLDLAHRIARVTGGIPDLEPHVTVAYFRGAADRDVVAGSLSRLRLPPQAIEARGLFSFGEEPHSHFGYTLLMRVAKDDALRQVHDAVRRAVGQRGPVFARPWADVDVHVRLVQRMPVPPATALRRLAERGDADPSLSFWTDALLVTEMAGDGFREWLRRPLDEREAAVGRRRVGGETRSGGERPTRAMG